MNRRISLKKFQDEILVKDEMAGRMSMFYAYPTSMLNALIEALSRFMWTPVVSEINLMGIFALKASICEEMIKHKRFDDDNTNMMCLRCMTGLIMLYDNLAPHGAFSKKSEIPITGTCNFLEKNTVIFTFFFSDCIVCLRKFQPMSDISLSTKSLLDSLRYATIHLHDPDTPKAIQDILDN